MVLVKHKHIHVVENSMRNIFAVDRFPIVLLVLEIEAENDASLSASPPTHRQPSVSAGPAARIPTPVPKDVKIRVIGSVDDLCQPSVHATLYRQKRLKETGHEVEVELVNGGHIMEPPYFPHHDLVYAKFRGFYCGYGGEVVLHAKSQEKTWANTIKFFQRTLGKTRKIEDWDRLEWIEEPRGGSKL